MAFNRSSLRRRPICAGSQIITPAPFIYGLLKNLEFTFYLKECNVERRKIKCAFLVSFQSCDIEAFIRE